LNYNSCLSKWAESCVYVYRQGEGVCIVTQLRESSPVAGTNCVMKQCIRLNWDLTKSSSMEHDVVPLTGCCARGGISERSAGGTHSERQAAPGPTQKSVHVRNAVAEVLRLFSAPYKRLGAYTAWGSCARH
jgi:hypothetical protein